MKTASIHEFDKWLKLLPWQPWLIPIQRHSKKPDVPEGESWKGAKYRLTVEQARQRLKNGLNVGVAATGHDFVFFDHDEPDKFMLQKETLTVQTRNGKIHKHYLNGGDVKNADGKREYKECGEVRAEWKYVLAPGSYVPPDDKARPGATGLYTVVVAKSPTTLHVEDLPPEFQPILIKNEQKEKREAVMTSSLRNQYGWSIEDIFARDQKLDDLLRSQNLAYPSPSEADMACLSKLLFWGYTESEAVDILKHFRSRPKLNREDYVERTLKKVGRGETIANYVDVFRWNPSTGYKLSFGGGEPDRDVEGKVGLVFHLVSKHVIKVKALKEGKAVTGWVTVDSPEKLRTSRNAKVLRDVLEKNYHEDSGTMLEKTIGRIEEAVSNWRQKTGRVQNTKSPEEAEKAKRRFTKDVEASIQIELAKITQAENQLEALKPHLDNVLIGEDKEKQAIFVLAMSGKYPEAEKKQMILLKGDSGGGKSTVQNGATVGLKTKVVGRFTRHGLDYADLESYEILMLKELGGMDLEKQGLSTLKFLSSDDKGYTVEMPIRDPETGRFKNTTYRIPPITVISSTTRLTLDSQFERRAWLFNVDESEEQTRKIALWKAKRKRQEYEKKLGLRKYTDYEFSREVVRRFVEAFEPTDIVIPFPKTLTEILGYNVLRVRGDIDKVYCFLEFYGAFNKKRLDVMEGPSGKVYALTPETCVESLKLIVNPLTNMLGKMDERAKLILDVLASLEDVVVQDTGLGELEKLVKYDKAGTEIDKKLRARIAAKTGKSDRTVRSFLNFLENSGFVSSDGGVGRTPKTFTLLYHVEDIKKKVAGISAKLESANDLVDKMRKEAQKWFNSLLETKILPNACILKSRLSVETGKIITPYRKEKIANKELRPLEPSLSKTTKYSWQNMKTPIILKEKLVECPICDRFDKTMFFANEQDLKLHIIGFHSGYVHKVT